MELLNISITTYGKNIKEKKLEKVWFIKTKTIRKYGEKQIITVSQDLYTHKEALEECVRKYIENNDLIFEIILHDTDIQPKKKHSIEVVLKDHPLKLIAKYEDHEKGEIYIPEDRLELINSSTCSGTSLWKDPNGKAVQCVNIDSEIIACKYLVSRTGYYNLRSIKYISSPYVDREKMHMYELEFVLEK